MAVAVLLRHEPLAEWLRIKTALCTDFIGQWRRAISDCDDSKELIAHASMPPYATLTGFDFAGVGQHCDVIAPKLYTMHWSLMVKFWADHLLAHNHGLDEQLLVRILVQLMDLADAETTCPSVSDYGYPEPHEPHPIPVEPHRRKLRQAMAAHGLVARHRSDPWCTVTGRWKMYFNGSASRWNPIVRSSGSHATATWAMRSCPGFGTCGEPQLDHESERVVEGNGNNQSC